jgi:F-type H+-transporting ATPase subunit c
MVVAPLLLILKYNMEILFVGLKLVAAGLAAISMVGSGVGIGIIFAGFLIALSRNPKEESKLFSYTLLGFALTEAIALFGLMIVFLILFGF